MSELIFEWDDTKALENLKKHLIAFEEALTLFNDPFAVTWYDPDHSISEHRFISIGISVKNRILIVCHTDRNGSVRIISSRKSTKRETSIYFSR